MPCFGQETTTQTPGDDSDATEEPVVMLDSDGLPMTEKQINAEETDLSTDEDPDALRRARRATEVEKEQGDFSWDLYGSARLHLINPLDAESGQTEVELGDGASRVGLFAQWTVLKGWDLSGRIESGFDIIDTFTPKAQNDQGGALTARLFNLGIESDSFYLKYGKSWSTYYRVAGVTDRFSIFGGSAAGVYNAGTDGGATGTGRAEEAIQSRFYVDIGRWAGIKPFNLNVQFQQRQAIPHVSNQRYSDTWSFSAWLETEKNYGIGVAWHNAGISDVESPGLKEAGIDGNANSFAIAVKTYGDRWLVSAVWARMDNIETTDQFKYVDGSGVELFGQWEFRDHWWLIGGGNWFNPDDDDPQAGEYEIDYVVVGMRYTFDSFKRMLYFEWKGDQGHLADGTPNKNEVTFGVRWDFGY